MMKMPERINYLASRALRIFKPQFFELMFKMSAFLKVNHHSISKRGNSLMRKTKAEGVG